MSVFWQLTLLSYTMDFLFTKEALLNTAMEHLSLVPINTSWKLWYHDDGDIIKGRYLA